MTSKALADFFLEHGDCNRSGDRIQAPPSVRVTLFVNIGTDPLPIEPVAAVEIKEDAAVVHTGRGERYVILLEDVRAIRFAGEGSKTGLV